MSVVRVAEVGEPDTAFSCPAVLRAKGKRISGFVSARDRTNTVHPEVEMAFTATGAHRDDLSEWPGGFAYKMTTRGLTCDMGIITPGCLADVADIDCDGSRNVARIEKRVLRDGCGQPLEGLWFQAWVLMRLEAWMRYIHVDKITRVYRDGLYNGTPCENAVRLAQTFFSPQADFTKFEQLDTWGSLNWRYIRGQTTDTGEIDYACTKCGRPTIACEPKVCPNCYEAF